MNTNPSHKSACGAVAKKRTKYEDEYEKLRDQPGNDFFIPSRLFETAVGHFWGMLGTCDYMRARFGFIDALGRIDTRDSVETQLDHARDMIRLCRSDNMGIREFVPFLMLRTDRDQKCYDFVKWYFTTGSKPDYDWGNMDLRFLDVKDASAFEDIMNLGLRGFCKLSHVVALTLLKAKMLLDLNTLESATDVVPRLNDMPRELFDSSSRSSRAAPFSLAYQLYCIVHTINPHFWGILFDPQSHLAQRPAIYSCGSLDEAQLVLGFLYRAWVETRGALELIKEKVDSGEWVLLLVLLGPVRCRLSTISSHPFPSNCLLRWGGESETAFRGGTVIMVIRGYNCVCKEY